ncbi:RagB/SusD family nutrient uptake outer membrane protein [Aquimarina sp. ERC-38]|uniref:RagB/SusD family nutrient uptake outer membrane protein n=1 Tax=Aquimarina sp. ERC-38 TaxID=2949996 RepID=UPI0022479BD5|nr:RagB/SusD family nutrient uptake outer membrane protein [Aquimarina sp. ERC-38]UZO82210.1 RagB/SusD family nutrient uptake outer membrane protein [Aquimarina sp. ERC-38]
MKTYTIRLLIACTYMLSICSCEDYVEEVNPNEIAAETHYQSLDESNIVLTSVYGAMLNESIVGAREEAWRSDFAFPGNRGRNIEIDALNIYQQIINEDNQYINTKWNALYQVIWRANQLIAGLEGMNDDLKSEELWTVQMGQARFFRGLAHFYLHSLYNNGEIVIRDVAPEELEDFSKPVSSSEEVIAFFREDLRYAYENLPPTLRDRSRVTAGTAATILGTSYLYSEDYENAKILFEDVINNAAYGYRLVQDWSIMFTEAGDFNSESIFEINYTTDQQIEDGNFDQESFFTPLARFSAPIEGGGASFNQQFTAASWLIHAYATEPLDIDDPRNIVMDRATGNRRIRKVSLRSSAMIAVVNDEDTEYYNAPSAPVLVNFGSNQNKYGYFKKYSNHDIVSREEETGGTSWKSGKNVIVNRLADVYLMYAECLLRGDNNIAGAIDFINPIRQRWGLQLLDPGASLTEGIPYTVETLMDHLMFVERPLELSVEGVSQRIIDLRRWGIAKERFTDLASSSYYLADYEYYDDRTGTTQTRARSLVRQGTSPDPRNNPQITQEYVGAAQFYATGYFPLPISETLNNNAVSGNAN